MVFESWKQLFHMIGGAKEISPLLSVDRTTINRWIREKNVPYQYFIDIQTILTGKGFENCYENMQALNKKGKHND